MTLMRIFSVALMFAMLAFSHTAYAGFGMRGGGFRTFRTYSPRIRPPSYRARPSTSLPKGRVPLRSSPVLKDSGGRFNSAYTGQYSTFGYHPTARQTSFFNTPWFWLWMMAGNSRGHAEEAVPPNQQQFEQNCKAAVASPDKPADLDVKPEECAALAQQAFAKVQAETAAANDTHANPLFWVVAGGVGFVICIIIGFSLLIA